VKKREWVYLLSPQLFEMKCPKCKGVNITWSEWESHLWCYDCKQDLDPKDTEDAGIFSGPIPIHATYLMGLHFDRILIPEEKIELFNLETFKWDPLNNLVKDMLLDKQDLYGFKLMEEGKKSFDRKGTDKVIEQRLNYFEVINGSVK
jgi:hypothetical protein